ncbi:hypothetical protein ACF06V_16190 [Streptomyces bobili]|uniref:hypothetical protein n=1 Tax=Streptomyces bobili TaxID=67280 RepID=UPI0036FC9930
MMNVLRRRAAPVLLLGQTAYVVLLEFAFTFLVPDTAELDHTESGSSGMLLYRVLVVVAVLGMLGGAVLLGSARVRDGIPRAVRAVWLALLALGEVAIAVAFAGSAVVGSPGPDTVISVLGILVSGCIAYSCIAEAGSAMRGAAPEASV